MPTSPGAATGDGFHSATRAATLIQAVFRRYRVHLAIDKARSLFNEMYLDIENTIGQCSSFIFPLPQGIHATGDETLAPGEVMEADVDEEEREEYLNQSIVENIATLAGLETVAEPDLVEKSNEDKPTKSLQELQAEEKWLEEVLRQRMEAMK